jgi:hypothetical protein
MRLSPLPGRVKFRPVQGFRVHFPALVECGAALPVESAAKVY